LESGCTLTEARCLSRVRSSPPEVAQRKTLTEEQVDLLRWVANDCPEGVMQDKFHRISAAALHHRGFIAFRKAMRTPSGTSSSTSTLGES
jgi:hypothetical protein